MAAVGLAQNFAAVKALATEAFKKATCAFTRDNVLDWG